MSSVSAIIPLKIQEIRAQSLATLMAAIAPPSAIGRLDNATTSTGLPVRTALPTGEIGAIILSPPQSGRILLAIADSVVAAELPPELARLARSNPEFFAKGSPLALQFDAARQSFHLALPTSSSPTPVQAATILNLSSRAQSLSSSQPAQTVEPVPPLARFFPAGSPGAAVERASGLVLPFAERAGAAIPPVSARPEAGRSPSSFEALAKDGSVPQGGSAILSSTVGAAIQRASALQLPLGTAMEALLARQGASASALPTQMQPALAALRAFRLDGTAKPASAAIQAALARSGLFLEANLAGGDITGNGPAPAAGQQNIPDIKAALLALRSMLASLPAPEIDPTARPSKDPAARSEVAGKPLSDVANQRAGSSATSAAPTDLAGLGRIVDGGIERIKLLQMASLPEHVDLVITDDRAQSMRLALSIPVATRGPDAPHTATIGMLIEHHQPTNEAARPEGPDANAGNQNEGFPWKVRIALDLEETGPVQAEIALRGQSVAVTLWAERKETASLARAGIGALHDALSGAAFDVTRLDIRDGRPIGAKKLPQPAVDRRS